MAADSLLVDLVKGLLVVGLIPLAIASVLVAFKLTRVYLVDRTEYTHNKKRSISFKDVVSGRVPTFHDGIRDERVMAGLAVDTVNNRWVEQGKLSEEAISAVLH